MRTFLLLGTTKSIQQINDRFFDNVLLLRLLDLSGADVTDISGNIKVLKLLQYADFSGSKIKMLPIEITSLLNLETLILEDCISLTSLPTNIHKLVKLSYLGLDVYSNLNSLPD